MPVMHFVRSNRASCMASSSDRKKSQNPGRESRGFWRMLLVHRNCDTYACQKWQQGHDRRPAPVTYCADNCGQSIKDENPGLKSNRGIQARGFLLELKFVRAAPVVNQA